MGDRLFFYVHNLERVLNIFGIILICCMSVKPETSLVEEKINRLTRHAIKTIQSEDGDFIDCIDIYKQPAFDHPALGNHTIQMTPTDHPSIRTMRATRAFEKSHTDSSVYIRSQLWRRRGSCPDGTIPIRRMRRTDLLKVNSLDNYGKTKPRITYHGNMANETQFPDLLQMNHSMAILLTFGYSYTGAKGDIKVFGPHVEADDEWTTSQIALKSGPIENYECVESGWAVNPGVYGDRNTRLFVYWTADSSKTTGCFDLTCPGFVQTSNEVALGAVIKPTSTENDLPYQITLYLFRDSYTRNWWVQYGEKTNVGYFPAELFMLLPQTAETVQWGGEVYSSRLGGVTPHTSTQMGTGHFPSEGPEASGWIKRIRIRDNSMYLKFPEWVDHLVDEFRCYDARYVGDYAEDPEFYYGGPGRNLMCP